MGVARQSPLRGRAAGGRRDRLDPAPPSGEGRGEIRPQLARFVLAGCAIFCAGMLQYSLLYALVPRTRYHAAVCWILNFLLGTLWTHAIHRYSTFRRTNRLPYFESLLRTYVGYAGINTIGAGMMLYLSDLKGRHHLAAWIVTTLVTSLMNFLVMRYFSIVSRKGS